MSRDEDEERVLKELMEIAVGLSHNGMMSKEDLDLVAQLCGSPQE